MVYSLLAGAICYWAACALAATFAMLHNPVLTPRLKQGLSWAAKLPFVAGVVVSLVFAGLALWGRRSVGLGADRWLNVMLGLAALATILAFVGGAYLAARYGRRASISIDAKVTDLKNGSFLLAARPVVTAVGIFRVKFHGPRGAVVRVRDVYSVDPSVSPTGLWEGEYRQAAAIFGDDDDNQQFAESGEALKTTVLFRVAPPEAVIGWMVVVAIRAPTRWMPWSSGAWGDKLFVPRPDLAVEVRSDREAWEVNQ